jgi:histidinol-phosphate/aromatic aminotransferase/cobyric acid decarboxylase-like protein
MMETKRPGAEVAKAYMEKKIMIGRVWPAWPTHVRVTVGTQNEMDKFMAATAQIFA